MTQADRTEQARLELLRQAERPAAEIVPAVVGARTALLRELDGVGEQQARFKPRWAEGEEAWSIAEVLRHVVQAEEGVAERMQKLARGQPAEGSVPGRLGGHESTPLAGLIDALHASRERLLRVAASLDGQERLDTTATHAFFGELNCRAWLALQGLHERAHARQLAQVKEAPGYPAAER